MTAHDWGLIVNATSAGLNEEWVNKKQEEFGLSPKFKWYYDQWITTLGLLKHKICTVPPYSGLWRNKHIGKYYN